MNALSSDDSVLGTVRHRLFCMSRRRKEKQSSFSSPSLNPNHSSSDVCIVTVVDATNYSRMDDDGEDDGDHISLSNTPKNSILS